MVHVLGVGQHFLFKLFMVKRKEHSIQKRINLLSLEVRRIVVHQKVLFVLGKELSQKVRIPKDILSSDKFECVRSTNSQFKEWYENSVAVRGLIKELVDMRLAFSETIRTEAVPWFEAKCESLELEAK
jgi:uncharacterized LabA/DUF88 family protein